MITRQDVRKWLSNPEANIPKHIALRIFRYIVAHEHDGLRLKLEYINNLRRRKVRITFSPDNR